MSDTISELLQLLKIDKGEALFAYILPLLFRHITKPNQCNFEEIKCVLDYIFANLLLDIEILPTESELNFFVLFVQEFSKLHDYLHTPHHTISVLRDIEEDVNSEAGVLVVSDFKLKELPRVLSFQKLGVNSMREIIKKGKALLSNEEQSHPFIEN